MKYALHLKQKIKTDNTLSRYVNAEPKTCDNCFFQRESIFLAAGGDTLRATSQLPCSAAHGTIPEYRMTENEQRKFITERILSRISGKGERRDEALRDVLGLKIPHLDRRSIEDIAGLVPELPVSLYRKWAGMFTDRLLETVEPQHISDLCQGTPESDASLLLVYAMFMESARMERVVADDLKSLGDPSLQ